LGFDYIFTIAPQQLNALGIFYTFAKHAASDQSDKQVTCFI